MPPTLTTPPTGGFEGVPFDPKTPNPARIWQSFINHKDLCWGPDRKAATALCETSPELPGLVLTHRYLHHRLVSRAVQKHAVRAVADLGCGYPALTISGSIVRSRTTAQTARYQARQPVPVLTVDHDDTVLTYLRGLDTDSDSFHLHADITNVTMVKDACAEHLGSGPRAYMLSAVAEYLDDETLTDLVTALIDGAPAGSVVCFSHTDATPETAKLAACWAELVPNSVMRPRGRDRLCELLRSAGVREIHDQTMPNVIPVDRDSGPIPLGPAYGLVALL